MQVILVFALVIGGVVGFMFLMLKICMWSSGSKATKVGSAAEKNVAASAPPSHG